MLCQFSGQIFINAVGGALEFATPANENHRPVLPLFGVENRRNVAAIRADDKINGAVLIRLGRYARKRDDQIVVLGGLPILAYVRGISVSIGTRLNHSSALFPLIPAASPSLRPHPLIPAASPSFRPHPRHSGESRNPSGLPLGITVTRLRRLRMPPHKPTHPHERLLNVLHACSVAASDKTLSRRTECAARHDGHALLQQETLRKILR